MHFPCKTSGYEEESSEQTNQINNTTINTTLDNSNYKIQIKKFQVCAPPQFLFFFSLFFLLLWYAFVITQELQKALGGLLIRALDFAAALHGNSRNFSKVARIYSIETCKLLPSYKRFCNCPSVCCCNSIRASLSSQNY